MTDTARELRSASVKLSSQTFQTPAGESLSFQQVAEGVGLFINTALKRQFPGLRVSGGEASPINYPLEDIGTGLLQSTYTVTALSNGHKLIYRQETSGVSGIGTFSRPNMDVFSFANGMHLLHGLTAKHPGALTTAVLGDNWKGPNNAARIPGLNRRDDLAPLFANPETMQAAMQWTNQTYAASGFAQAYNAHHAAEYARVMHGTANGV